MPTGYTAGVQNGSVTDFREYALTCARQFGACILLRDDPLSAEIPEFQPSDYHEQRLKEARERLRMLSKCSLDHAEDFAAHEHADAINNHRDRQERDRLHRQRYEAMLAKAKAFNPPTPDHQGLAEFMVSQLEESIGWDCGKISDPPEPVTGEEWLQRETAKCERDIEYHEKEHQKEVDRTNDRNAWVKALRDSLPAPSPTSTLDGVEHDGRAEP